MNNDDIKVTDSRLFNNDGSVRDEDSRTSSENQSQTTKTTKTSQDAHTSTPSPEIDFNTFILSLASSVQISLGVIPHPVTQQTHMDLTHAKQTIDILGLLEEKTNGNLQPDESGLLKNILFQLRMQYVEKSKTK